MDLHHLLLATLPAHSALPPTSDTPPRCVNAMCHFGSGAKVGVWCSGTLRRDVLFWDDCDDPARWYAGRNLPHRADQSRHQRALDRQRRSFVPILGEPATTRQGLISCLERFHASPMVAVHDTAPAANIEYQRTVKQRFHVQPSRAGRPCPIENAPCQARGPRCIWFAPLAARRWTLGSAASCQRRKGCPSNSPNPRKVACARLCRTALRGGSPPFGFCFCHHSLSRRATLH
jgi:hypothetical protein